MATTANSGATYLPTAGEGPVQQWHGTYAATVVNNHDPLGVGRLQLNVPQVLGNSVSGWAVPHGTYYTIPANGSTVSATFLGGDPGQPMWSGALDLAPSVNTGAVKVSYSVGAPANPTVGDIWYPISTALGGEVVGPPQVWTFDSGTSTFNWVTQPSVGTTAITPGAITEALLGSDVTGIIDGKSTANLSTSIPASANVGDVWMQVNSSGIVVSIMQCTTAYTSGGTSSNWTTETSMSARAIGSPFVYQQSLTPNTANNGSNPPQVNDLWINTGNSNAITQMTGGTSGSPTWTTFQMGANAIQNGAISANHIAVGTIVAGIVNGTSIIATATSGGDFLAYSGTPTTGNLIMSISPVATTDAHSNTVPQGFNLNGASGSYVNINDTGLYGAGMYAKASSLTYNYQPAAFSAQALGSGSSTAEQQMIVISSGKQSANGGVTLQDDAALQIKSASTNGSTAASINIEFGGGSSVALFTPTGVTFGQPVSFSGGLAQNQIDANVFQVVETATSATTVRPALKGFTNNPGAGNESMTVYLTAGATASQQEAYIVLQNQPADDSVAPYISFVIGGVYVFQTSSSGIAAPNFSGSYHGSQSVSGWPIAAGSGTVGPAQLSAGLSSALNSIYNAGHSAGIW